MCQIYPELFRSVTVSAKPYMQNDGDPTGRLSPGFSACHLQSETLNDPQFYDFEIEANIFSISEHLSIRRFRISGTLCVAQHLVISRYMLVCGRSFPPKFRSWHFILRQCSGTR